MTDKPAQDPMDVIIGTAVYSFAAALIRTGMSPTVAVQRTAFAIIEGTVGRDAMRSLGIPRPTLSRWRREVAAAAEAGEKLDVDETFVEIANVLLPQIGLRDMRIVRGSDDG